MTAGGATGGTGSRDFEGLVAVVTGGASGIGLAAAILLARRGARVAALDLRPDSLPTDLPTGPDEVTSGPAIVGIACDVSDDASVTAAIDRAGTAFGRIDVLVNNAGIGAQGTVEENTDDEWHRVLDVNVVGIARVTRAVLPWLRRSPAAAVVNTCSVAGWSGLPRRAVYSASKGAVHALTLAMAADHVREGVRVNCVMPGTADTPWVGRLLDAATDPAAERAALEARQPMGRLVSPEEVAAAIVYLASPACGSTTGTALAVDGGMYGLRLPPR